METAGISDVIVNCMALAFILSIDEMIFERLATVATKHMMQNLEEMALFSTDTEEEETHQEVLARYNREELGQGRWRILGMIIPKRLLYILLIMSVFIFKYYHDNCEEDDDGSWVSKAMYLPKIETYNPLDFMPGGHLLQSTDAFWEMP